MRPGRAGWLVSALTALTVGAQAAPGAPGRLVYLDFTDGTEGITRGDDDDATRNVSRLCAAPSLARWEPAARGGERERFRADVLHAVRGYFEAYDVRFTLDRPAPPETFTTIVVAPPLAACTFGRRGVAFADCGDVNPASLAFVFDCYGDADSCAVLVAHETAHTFGLVHSLDPADIMTPGPEDPSLRFLAEASPTAAGECGVLRQSSHQALLAALGPRRPGL
jgi:hypothetical protein